MDKLKLQKIVEEAQSKADICRALNLAPKGGNYAKIDRLLKENNITWNKPSIPWNKGKKYKYTQYRNIQDILVEDSPHKNTSSLKKRLIQEGLKNAKCEVCGYDEVIELHHINGDPTDNRIENLQILCPNCHSKTENFRAKNIKGRVIQDPKELFLTEEEIKQRELKRKAKKCNKTIEEYINTVIDKKLSNKKICSVCNKEFKPRESTQKYCCRECYLEDNKGNRPSLLQLLKDFSELNSFTKVGNKYNVSDNSVRKWCKLYGIPFHTKELKEYIENVNNIQYIPTECKKCEKKVINYEKIISDYLLGLSTSEVANLNNCDPTTVRKILYKNNIKLRSRGSKIEQYDLNNNLITTFETMKEVCDYIIKTTSSTNPETISGSINRCCRGKSKSAYGYIWKKL